jgi:hypothetical protein
MLLNNKRCLLFCLALVYFALILSINACHTSTGKMRQTDSGKTGRKPIEALPDIQTVWVRVSGVS